MNIKSFVSDSFQTSLSLYLSYQIVHMRETPDENKMIVATTIVDLDTEGSRVAARNGASAVCGSRKLVIEIGDPREEVAKGGSLWLGDTAGGFKCSGSG